MATATIVPHPLSCTADFSVDVYLVAGNELDGLWVFDMEDGTFSLVRSVVTPDESRQCSGELAGPFYSVEDAMRAGRELCADVGAWQTAEKVA